VAIAQPIAGLNPPLPLVLYGELFGDDPVCEVVLFGRGGSVEDWLVNDSAGRLLEAHRE
jgi:hypothetical protein